MQNKLMLMLAFIGLAACSSINTNNFGADDRAYMIKGVSVAVPDQREWVKLDQSDTHIAFGKESDESGESKAFLVSIFLVEPITNSDQLLQTIKQLRSENQNTGRFEVISNEEELYGTYSTCVRHHSITKDNAASLDKDIGYMVLDVAGYSCSHALANDVIVKIEVSERRYPDSKGIDTKKLAERMLETVKMHPFQ